MVGAFTAIAAIATSLAQSGGRIDVALQIGAGAAAVALIWAAASWYGRRRGVKHFKDFAQQPGFEPIDDHDELAALSESVGDVFSDMSMYARQLTIRGALRHPDDAFKVNVVHVVIGFEASNAQHQTMDKVVVLVSGFDAPLPRFRLLPSNFMFRQIHRNPVFDAGSAVGRSNLVLGRDHQRIRAVLDGGAAELLQNNRALVIEARPALLAFFLHDERVEPDDLGTFVADCLNIATAVRADAAAASSNAS